MRLRLFAIIPLLLTFLTVSAHAQKKSLKLQDLFGTKSADVDEAAKITTSLKPLHSGVVELSVHVEVPDGFFIYSTNRDYAAATVIDIQQANGLVPLSDFKPDRAPKTKYERLIKKTLEKFYRRVTWTRRYQIKPGTDSQSVFVSGSLTGTYCTDGMNGGGKCIPIRPAHQFRVGINDSQDGSASAQPTMLAQASVPDPPTAAPEEPLAVHPYARSEQPERGGRTDPLALEFALVPENAKPGDTVDLKVTMSLDPDWHAYAQSQSEDGGLPTEFSVTPYGLEDVSGAFESDVPPITHLDTTLDVELIYFEHQVTWTRRFQVAENRPPGHYGVRGDITYQVCRESTGCLPPNTVKFSLGKTGGAATVIADASAGREKSPNRPDDSRRANTPEEIAEMATYYRGTEPIRFETLGEQIQATFWTALFGAFVGGILLNLMPCVFPVLGIKVMGFVQQAGSDPKKIRLHGLVFTAGLIVSMWMLSGVLLVLRRTSNINWGQQMGEPVFVGSMIILLFVLGLNLAGIFEFGTSMTQVGGVLQNKKGYSSSFFSGILTTLIATPCSGPFLGAAMGYTLAQPDHIAIFLFTVFGLGIALPYLFLAFFPVLINKLPRPGAWMETFKVTMAFALFATSAFFMQTFGGQTGAAGLSWLTMAMVVIGLSLYLYGRFGLPHLPKNTRYVKGFAIPAVIASIGLWMAWDAMHQPAPEIASHGEWENWHPGKVEYLVAKKKRIVWVDYTADW